MVSLCDVRGVLIDLDGVLYIGNQSIPGAAKAVARLQSSNVPCRFITNTSTLSLQALQAKINRLGFNVKREEIISAPQAALLFLHQQENPTCKLLLADEVKADFAHLPQSDTAPRFVVVGDIGNAWNYALLNEVFNALMRGAKLIALHKNKFWQTEHGLQMDIGAFITGLEYASGTQATIMGKPSADFFRTALASMEVTGQNALIVGDDIDSDIGGGQQAGIKGVLVKTGKYRQSYVDRSDTKPDLVLESIADLPAALGL